MALTNVALLTTVVASLWSPVMADEKPTPAKEPAKPGVLFTLPEDPKKTPDDLKALQGTWQAISLEHNGEKSSAEAVKNFRVVIRDNAITFESDGHKHEATFLLLTASRPKAIWLKAQPKDPVIRAIYELKGDRLIICVDNDKGTAMPTEFAAKAESGLTLIVLEREPPPKKVGDASKEKRFPFAFKNAKWSEVFEYLTDQTGLPFVGVNVPKGTFSFTPPEGKTYTLSEILDIINEILLADSDNKKWLMVLRTRSFGVIPADQKAEPGMMAIVKIEDLPIIRNSEIVRILVKLEWASATDIEPIVEKMLGEYGRAITVEETNTLILTDRGGFLRPVARLIADLDREAKKP
jgi:uncharacterized protein (TIGR03067 family)